MGDKLPSDVWNSQLMVRDGYRDSVLRSWYVSEVWIDGYHKRTLPHVPRMCGASKSSAICGSEGHGQTTYKNVLVLEYRDAVRTP